MSLSCPRPRPRFASPLRDLTCFVEQIAPGRAPGSSRRWGRLAPVAALGGAGVLAVLLATHGASFAHAAERLLHAGWAWLALAAVLEVASICGYVWLLHHVVSAASSELRWRDSYDISLAGTAATRLLPTAGLGGAAVTVWALRAHGVRSREVAERLLAFLVLLYSVYMAALVLGGLAIGLGLVHVPHGRALGLLGAGVGAVVSALALLVMGAPGTLARLLARGARRGGRLGALAARGEAGLPALRAALTRSARELRRPRPALLGALAWWGFDIAVLGAMLHAFGADPDVTVLAFGYFLGTAFNVLPLPGSLSGGLASVLIALGTPAGPAIAAVLAYRTLAVWLPAGSGLLSLARLRTSAVRWRHAAA